MSSTETPLKDYFDAELQRLETQIASLRHDFSEILSGTPKTGAPVGITQDDLPKYQEVSAD